MVYYLGYKEPGSTYPSVEFPEFDFTDVRLDSNSKRPNPHLITGVSAFQAGESIDPGHVPTALRWASSRLPYDYITLHGSSIVSPRMKEIIERFEPRMHQFFPLKVVDKAGDQIAERWLWVVCVNIDSVDREHTTYKFVKDAIWMSNYRDGDKRVRIPDAKLILSSTKTVGHHFWRDTRIMGGAIYASDEAGKALLDAGLTGLAGSRQETV